MQEPATPVDEAFRISTLHDLNLLDTPSEDRFDRLTRICQQLFKVPMALISLIDSDRQWFKSAAGLNISETPRSVSFCGHTILEQQIFVVNDTHLDHRFADNPLVTNAPHIRFYAGRPLSAANGQPIGTLCVLDREPRGFDPVDARLLNDLSELIEKEINFPDLKTLNERLRQSEQQLLDSLAQLRNNERHERARNRSLELISRGYALREVLNSIAYEIEQCCPDAVACIELINNSNDSDNRYWGQRRQRDPQPGVWSCYAAGISATNGDDLGTLTIVRPQPGTQDSSVRRLIEESAILAGIAIERDQSDRMVWKQANYDSLTGLPNRNLLRERLGQELTKARRRRLRLGLMFIDLDHFKAVNDTFGHQQGDNVLTRVGKRLQTCMRDSDTVARLGGDEFTVLAVELSERKDIESIAGKILEELSREFKLDQASVFLSASIGIAFYPDHGEDMDTLIRYADDAMYTAKNSGGNRFFINSDK